MDSILNYLQNDKPVEFKLLINNIYEQSINDVDCHQKLEDNTLQKLISKDIIQDNTQDTTNINKSHNMNTKNNNMLITDKKLSNILDIENYYIYNYDNKENFLGSILSIIDDNFVHSSKQSKIQLIQEFKNKIYFEIEKNNDYFKNNHQMKNNIKENLLSDKKINNETQRYISELLNINIVIISNEEYHILNNFKDNRKSIILFYNKEIYSSLLNQYNLHYIDNNIIKKIKHLYTQKYKEDNTEKFKHIKKMKMPELYKICEEMNISIHNGKKKKIKKDLLEEIINKI